MYTHTCVCISLSLYIYIHTTTYICICIYTYIYIYGSSLSNAPKGNSIGGLSKLCASSVQLQHIRICVSCAYRTHA